VVDREHILDMRKALDEITISDEVATYAASLVRKTRELPSVELGASPRAAVHLLGVAKFEALMAGRDFVTPDDAATVAPNVLRHRVLLRAEAELEQYTADDAIQTALRAVPVPR